MSGLGKKILGAFVEMKDDKEDAKASFVNPAAATEPGLNTPGVASINPSEKFQNYFDKLFKESNIPGPDYFEFSKMVEAMSAIPDEKTKYLTAFAGLSIQGLDKKKLLETANHYLGLIDEDAKNFQAIVAKALQDKVTAKKKEMDDKTRRIQDLNKEIAELSSDLQAISNEVKENEEKINANAASYQHEMLRLKDRISQDAQKINQFIS
ncbi:MAG: hypothetical protein ABI151_12605 [Chitinophagaceae bacterium]